MLPSALRRLVLSLCGPCARSRPRPRSGRGPRFHKPCLEAFEDRTAPAVVNWIGGSGTDWNTPGNWSDTSNGTNHVPTVNDDAVITSAAVTSMVPSAIRPDRVPPDDVHRMVTPAPTWSTSCVGDGPASVPP